METIFECLDNAAKPCRIEGFFHIQRHKERVPQLVSPLRPSPQSRQLEIALHCEEFPVVCIALDSLIWWTTKAVSPLCPTYWEAVRWVAFAYQHEHRNLAAGAKTSAIKHALNVLSSASPAYTWIQVSAIRWKFHPALVLSCPSWIGSPFTVLLQWRVCISQYSSFERQCQLGWGEQEKVEADIDLRKNISAKT